SHGTADQRHQRGRSAALVRPAVQDRELGEPGAWRARAAGVRRGGGSPAKPWAREAGSAAGSKGDHLAGVARGQQGEGKEGERRRMGGAFVIRIVVALGIAGPAAADHVKGGRAVHRIVVQVNEDNPQLWNLMLNNIANLIGAMGKEHVDIKVIAYGP